MAELKTTIYSHLFRGLKKGERRPEEYIVGTVCAIWSIPFTCYAQKRSAPITIIRGAEIRRTYAPPRIPPGRRYREYSILELPVIPAAVVDIAREQVEARTRAEMLGDKIYNLRVLLEADEIIEEEYQKREKEIRAKYEKI